MPRRVLPAVAGLLLTVSAVADPPDAVAPAEIPNYRLIRPDLATAGQPSPEALRKLRELGFHTVINLRTEKEGALEERSVVEAQGLRYVWVPITAQSFGLPDVEAVEKVIDDPAASPVLLHCASSNRVGAVWTVIQVREGKSLDVAEAAGHAAGLNGPVMEAAVHRVLGALGQVAPTIAVKP